MSRPAAIILDRDGVINRDSADFIRSPEEFVALPGSMEAIGKLSQAGIRVAVASNQSGLGRGYLDRQTLYSIHRKLRRGAARFGGEVEQIAYCPHLPDAGCDCRKPKPGLFFRLLRRLNLEASEVIAVGDSARDVQAANAAGVEARLVLTGNGQKAQRELDLPDSKTWRDLAHVVSDILASGRV